MFKRVGELAGVAVFGGDAPGPLQRLPTVDIDRITDNRRIIVTGGSADLATVLAALLRADRLDIEVAHATGWWSTRRALTAAARRVPLIRDETGAVIVGAAEWHGVDGADLYGEAVVDDTVLFDGDVSGAVPGIRVEPTRRMPGLRASVLSADGRPRRWVTGRAAQLGTTGVRVTRDGITAPKPLRRSTFYRHIEGWLRVG